MSKEDIKTMIHERIRFANDIIDDWDMGKERENIAFKVVLQQLLEPLDVTYEPKEEKKRRGVQ